MIQHSHEGVVFGRRRVGGLILWRVSVSASQVGRVEHLVAVPDIHGISLWKGSHLKLILALIAISGS